MSDEPDAEICLYLTTHNIIPAPAGFETAIPGSDRPQTHALERAANGVGKWIVITETKMFHQSPFPPPPHPPRSIFHKT
jgi:hypothetical protein